MDSCVLWILPYGFKQAEMRVKDNATQPQLIVLCLGTHGQRVTTPRKGFPIKHCRRANFDCVTDDNNSYGRVQK